MVLPLLDSGLPAARTRPEVNANWDTDFGDLPDFRFWQRRRGMAFFHSDSKRLFRERCAQVGNVSLRADGSASRNCVSLVRAVVHDTADWPRDSRAPRILVQFFHLTFCPFPIPS